MIVKRLFKIGQAETNALIDKFENPIKISKQGILDLRKLFEKNLQSLAKVKAITYKLDEQIRKATIPEVIETLKDERQKNEKYVKKIEDHIKKVQARINAWESDLIRLEARYESAKTAKRVNKELAKINSSGIIATHERMKEKIVELECESKAYEDIINKEF